MKVVLIMIFIAMGVASASEINKEFKNWMVRFNRTYSSREELIKRRGIFQLELEFVRNFTINNRGSNYTLALNEFSDLTLEEMVNCTDIPPPDELMMNVSKGSSFDMFNMSDINVPKFVDWRREGAVTRIKKQSTYFHSCGSCWAFAAVASIEGMWKIQTHQLISLSEQQLVDCSTGSDGYGRVNRGCKSGHIDIAYRYVMEGGIASEDSYPYRGYQGKCYDDRVEPAARIDSYVPLRNERQILWAVGKQPVAIPIRIDSEFKNYEGGVHIRSCGAGIGGHGVTIVGYNLEEKYWIVKNSWGANWGESGYMRLMMGIGGSCPLEYGLYPTVLIS